MSRITNRKNTDVLYISSSSRFLSFDFGSHATPHSEIRKTPNLNSFRRFACICTAMHLAEECDTGTQSHELQRQRISVWIHLYSPRFQKKFPCFWRLKTNYKCRKVGVGFQYNWYLGTCVAGALFVTWKLEQKSLFIRSLILVWLSVVFFFRFLFIFQHKKPIYLTTNLMSCDNGTAFSLIESSAKGKTSRHLPIAHTHIHYSPSWEHDETSISYGTTKDKNPTDCNQIEIGLQTKKKRQKIHFFFE